MKRVSKCCQAKIHKQNEINFCTECITPLLRNETKMKIRPFVYIISSFLFFYIVLNTSFAYAPQYFFENSFNFFNKKENVLYSVDIMQIKIIEGNKSDAVSISGAIGNMQIMPVTLEDWNKQHPKENYTINDLKNESVNIKIGVWMITKRIPEILKSENIPLTINNILIAYNWGSGNLVNWYRSGAVVSKLPNETQQYICKYWAKAKI